MTDYHTIYTASIHGEHDFNDAPGVKVKGRIIFDHFEIRNLFERSPFDEEGTAEFVKIAKPIFDAIPSLKKSAENDDYWCHLIHFCGTLEELKETADAVVNYAIPVFYESGGDGDHFDYLPSFLEEIIQFCTAIDYLVPLQKLYDSFWQGPPVHLKSRPDVWGESDDNGNLVWPEKHAFYPPTNNDPCLYLYFQNLGLNLHKDHPKD